jgi:hypothetical protein
VNVFEVTRGGVRIPAVLAILKSLLCRHRWQTLRTKEGDGTVPAVTLQYVGGFKILRRCETCGRLKWFKGMDT